MNFRFVGRARVNDGDKPGTDFAFECRRATQFERIDLNPNRARRSSRIGHYWFATGAMTQKLMRNVSLRAATGEDTAFALYVTEACMRVYAERTWGSWDGRADLDPACDEVMRLAGRAVGLIGVDRSADGWFLDKLYLLPAYQSRGIGSYLLRRLIDDANAAQVELRLTVLEVNPARRFYERHGFVVTQTISPRHHMKWCGR